MMEEGLIRYGLGVRLELDEVKEIIKSEFQSISKALYQGKITLQESENRANVFAEASPMFGQNIIRYNERNFEYFYIFQKYLCNVIDIVDIKILDKKPFKLHLNKDLFSLKSIEQISGYKEKDVPNIAVFYECNFILNIYTFLHECGHLNQEIKDEKKSISTNHFSEFNADSYALSTILKYYASMKINDPLSYFQRVQVFKNEHNLFRVIITNSLLLTYLHALADFNSDDTETHPSTKKRFSYLFTKTILFLKDNFNSLFAQVGLDHFLGELYKTLFLIENSLFEDHKIKLEDLFDFFSSNLGKINEQLKGHEGFDKIN